MQRFKLFGTQELNHTTSSDIAAENLLRWHTDVKDQVFQAIQELLGDSPQNSFHVFESCLGTKYQCIVFTVKPLNDQIVNYDFKDEDLIFHPCSDGTIRVVFIEHQFLRVWGTHNIDEICPKLILNYIEEYFVSSIR